MFNWKNYIQKYSDLQHLTTERAAVRHYQLHGKREGRTDQIDTIILTGEKIQLRCDYFIGTEQDVKYNPVIYSVIRNNDRWINIYNYNSYKFENVKINAKVFVYTYILEKHLDSLVDILKNFKEYTLYFHNSDGNFLRSHYEVLNVPECKKIYSQNNTVQEVITLPIGIANAQWPHGNQQAVWEILNENIPKTKEIFFNFSMTIPLRERCKEELVPFLEWVPTTDYITYLRTLAQYKYCICIEGNGLDTHRFWECLYLKVIPICVKNEWTNVTKDIFPMILLESWVELRKYVKMPVSKKGKIKVVLPTELYNWNYSVPEIDLFFQTLLCPIANTCSNSILLSSTSSIANETSQCPKNTP